MKTFSTVSFTRKENLKKLKTLHSIYQVTYPSDTEIGKAVRFCYTTRVHGYN